MIRMQIQKWGHCLCFPAVLFTFSLQHNAPQNCKAQAILPTVSTIEAALEITISQVSEKSSLYIIIIVINITIIITTTYL